MMIQSLPKRPMDIHIVSESRQTQCDNPCVNNNGGCSDVCTVTVNGGVECSCPDFSDTRFIYTIITFLFEIINYCILFLGLFIDILIITIYYTSYTPGLVMAVRCVSHIQTTALLNSSCAAMGSVSGPRPSAISMMTVGTAQTRTPDCVVRIKLL